MAHTVDYSFTLFNEALELSGSHESTAQDRCDHLIELLENDFSIIEAFPSGSIERQTAIRGYADLDIVVVLDEWEWKHEKPSEVLQRVRDVLAPQKQAQIRKNGQAVTIHYATWPKVDVVPAGRELHSVRDWLVIPDMNNEEWLESRPAEHTKRMASRVNASRDEFLQLVRMFKWWNLTHGQWLPSFHLEALALEHCRGDLSDFPWELHQLFEASAKSVKSYSSPSGFDEEYLNYETRPEAVKRLETAADLSSDAWWHTYKGRGEDEEAIKLWCQLFPDRFPSYG